MSDYKDAIQAIFEEMCSEKGYDNYWELSDEIQYKLYTEASQEYFNRMADWADNRRKAERERI